MTKTAPTAGKHQGGCHCGAIRFEVEIDPAAGAMCNCTICTKIAWIGAFAKPAAFTLLSGGDSVSSYAWASKTSQRKFCKHCGVHCYGLGHLEALGGDYVSINLNCLDGIDPARVQRSYWDGRHDNWQAGQRDTPWLVSA